ncbi:MAG: choice-of-anchor D domain-containing protein, partial [Myxococcales bacterium]|nr:choice-of-anchor D domain-containing protein [Myxococcales bacterium]
MRAWALPSLAFALGALAGCHEPGLGLPRTNLRLEPASLDFLEVNIGTVRPRSVQVINDGDAVVQLVGVQPAAGSSDAFSPAFSRTTLQPGDTATLSVTFAPTEVGEAEAVWTVAEEGGAGPVLTLRGAAVDAAGQVELCDDVELLDFGAVMVGGTRSIRFALCNLASTDRVVTVAEGINAELCEARASASFCLSSVDTPPLSLDRRVVVPARGSVELEARFTPPIAGTRERGSVVFSDCETSACRHPLRMEGFGLERALRCDPPAVDFGQAAPGLCTQRTLHCTNITGAPLQVRAWQAPAPFAPEATRLVQLEDLESFDVALSYCPTESQGRDRAELTLETDLPAPANLVTVPLEGGPAGPRLELMPAALDFGPVSTARPRSMQLLVVNTGFDTATLTGLEPDEANTGAFTVDALPGPVPPGGVGVITVTFSPTRAEAYRSRLVLQTDIEAQPTLDAPLRGEGVDVAACRYQVAPAALAFDDVLTHRSLTRDVLITNTGNSPCIFYDVALSGDARSEFELVAGPARADTLAVGETRRLSITHRPLSAGSRAAVLTLDLSSGVPPLELPLTARGVHSEAALVAPNLVDFGDRSSGCLSEERVVRLHNPTPEPITITAISSEGGHPGVILGVPRATPFQLTQDQYLELTVALQASGDDVQDSLLIEGTRAGAPVRYRVQLRASPSATGEQELVFEPTPDELDILFIVDFSLSTDTQRSMLVDAMPQLLQHLDDLQIDYRLGITTTDSTEEAGRLMHPGGGDPFGGPFEDRVITRATPGGPLTRFASTMSARPSDGGSASQEATLFATYQALMSERLEMENRGFLRPRAALSVVTLTDEPEQTSRSIGAPSDHVEYYLDVLRSLKGFDDNQISANIMGRARADCGSSATVGPPVDAYIRATGGDIGAPCGTPPSTDWMSALAPAVAQHMTQ